MVTVTQVGLYPPGSSGGSTLDNAIVIEVTDVSND